MANKRLNIRGGLNIKAGLTSGAGDPVLTKDATTSEVGQIPAVDTSAYLSTALNAGQIYVGNNSNIAQARTVFGDISMDSFGNVDINNGAIFNQHVANNAGILYSKLILTNGIVNADINAAAGIARTKLASGTAYRVVVNSSLGVMSDNAAITGNRVLISDNNGVPTHSTVTNTTLTYLDISSSLTAQLATKLTFIGSPVEGDLLQYSGGAWARLPIGTNGFVLTSNGTNAAWASGVSNGLPVGGTAGQYLNKIDGTNYNAQWSTLTISKVTDITASAAELNIMDGVTATTTEINFSSGVTSSIQTQLNNKLSRSLNLGNLFIGDAGNIAVAFPPGSNGQVLTVVGSIPQWQTPTPPGNVSGVAPTTDNAIVRWNGVGALSVQNSGIIIDDSNNVTGVTSLSSGQVDILNQAEVRFHETGSTNYVGIRAATIMSADYTITLPADAPSIGQYLQYNGTDYIWATGTSIIPGGGTGAVQFNNAGAFAGSVELSWNNGANTLTIGGNASGSNGVLILGGTTGVATIASGGGVMDISASILTLYATGANPINFRTNSTLRASIGATGAFLWGGTAGSSGQILKSNGAGGPPTWQNDTGFTLTDGNGTTANGTAVDWGGSLGAAVFVDASGFSINFDNGSFNVNNTTSTITSTDIVLTASNSIVSNLTDGFYTNTITSNPSQNVAQITDGSNVSTITQDFASLLTSTTDGSNVSSIQILPYEMHTSVFNGTDTTVMNQGGNNWNVNVAGGNAYIDILYTTATPLTGMSRLVYATDEVRAGNITGSTLGVVLRTNNTNRLTITDANVWTMNLGSDATGDLYYRNSSGNLTRRAIGTTNQVLTVVGGLPTWSAVPAVSDGNKGDITVSSTGTVWTVNNGAISYAKIQSMSNGRLLGRSGGVTPGTGNITEITNILLGTTGDGGTERIVEARGSSTPDLWLVASGVVRSVNDDFYVGAGSTIADTLHFTDSLIQKVAPSTSTLTIQGDNQTGTGGNLILKSGDGTTTDGQVWIDTLTNGNFRLVQAPSNDDALTQVLVRDAATGFVKYRTAASIAGGITDGDKGDITVSSSGAVWTVDNSAITFAKIQDIAGVSVIGRAANSTGVPAAITAGSDGLVLRRAAGSLAFGTITTSSLDNSAVTLAKIANIATGRVLGRTSASSGVVEELTNLILGNTGDSGNRTISVVSSTSNAGLTLNMQNSGVFTINGGRGDVYLDQVNFSVAGGNIVNDHAVTIQSNSGTARIIHFRTNAAYAGIPLQIEASSGLAADVDGGDLILSAGTAYFTSGNGNGGDILIQSGSRRVAGAGVDGNITIDALTGHLILANLPTSSAGLPAGTVWKNGTVLNIV